MIDISAGIGILLATLSVNAEGDTQAQEYRRASKAVVEIYYKESGIEERLKEYEKRFIHPDLRRWGGNVAVVTKIVVEQQLVFKWEF